MTTPNETMPPLPVPDTHCFDEDTNLDCWSYSADQMHAYAIAALAQPVQPAQDENRCVRELRDYAAKNPGTYIFPGWDGHRITKYLVRPPIESGMVAFARAIEAAHNIKAEKA